MYDTESEYLTLLGPGAWDEKIGSENVCFLLRFFFGSNQCIQLGFGSELVDDYKCQIATRQSWFDYWYWSIENRCDRDCIRRYLNDVLTLLTKEIIIWTILFGISVQPIKERWSKNFVERTGYEYFGVGLMFDLMW